MNTYRPFYLLVAVLLIGATTGCAVTGAGGTIHEDPAALHGDYSGKGFSGSVAVIRLPGDIPHVPESNGKRARWTQVERDQVLYLDADCQMQLYKQLPGWAQAIVREGGWQALATAVGQMALKIAVPELDVVRYALAGMGYGAPSGANTGRYRQDSSEKSAQGYCLIMNGWEAKKQYGILPGVNFIPWVGDGHSELPAAESGGSGHGLPKITNDEPPPFMR